MREEGWERGNGGTGIRAYSNHNCVIPVLILFCCFCGPPFMVGVGTHRELLENTKKKERERNRLGGSIIVAVAVAGPRTSTCYSVQVYDISTLSLLFFSFPFL